MSSNSRVKYVGNSAVGEVFLYADGVYRAGRLELEVVPCTYCGLYTHMLATEMCDGCWELTSRLSRFLQGKPAAIEFVRETLAQHFDAQKKAGRR